MFKAKEESIEGASYISGFVNQGSAYHHYLFWHEDDRAETVDENLNIVLRFTADCNVFDKIGRTIGKIRTVGRDEWTFVPSDNRIPTMKLGKGAPVYLERKIAIAYLNGELEAKPIKPFLPWREVLGDEHYKLMLKDFEEIRSKTKKRKGKPDDYDMLEIEMDRMFQSFYKKFLY